MAYKVVYKKRFTNKLLRLLDYLEKEWNYKVAKDFLSRLDKRIDILKKQPFIGKPSFVKPEVRSVLIAKHNRLYYKFKNNTLTILNMYDLRINPKKNRYK
ncbi:MAG TPA: type II toxin-antitoxin system RelE/ParE family toxin [Parafilimonas sp.]|nr:type II toxin-antitoxin system RelE/ParE family toxin [Parafilimonas sp.]